MTNYNLQTINFESSPWENNTNTIWLASTLKLHRNIDKNNFPAKMDIAHRKQMIDRLKQRLLSLKMFKNLEFFEAEDLGPLEKQYLFEHYISSTNFNQAHQGEGFVIDKNGKFIAIINIHDHLQLQLIDCQSELEETWNLLLQLEKELGKFLHFAISPKFGFLTSNPHICGTGLNISSFLHLPVLIQTGKLQDLLENQHEEDVIASSLEGTLEDILADILIVKNKHTLGVSEEKILRSVRAATLHLIVAEKSARTKVESGKSTEVKDKIAKAFGMMIHAYNLDIKDALKTLSLCKLGVELNWIDGISLNIINQLFFTLRRAHLWKYFHGKVAVEDLVNKRASFIQEKFKNAKLTIPPKS